jgi:hypothetical protein
VNFLMTMHVYLIRNVRIHNPCQPRAVRDIERSLVKWAVRFVHSVRLDKLLLQS